MKNGKTEGGTLISQVHQVCQRVWSSVLNKHGLSSLSGARGRIIFALWSENNIPIKRLVEKTSLDKSTLTGIIDRLERDGFVKRTKSPKDKRTVLISLTGKDEVFKEKIPVVSVEQNAYFYKGFSKIEIIEFENMLKRILQNCNDAEEALENQTN